MTTHQPTLDIPEPDPPPIPHPTQPGNLPAWITKQLHTNRNASRRKAQYHHCPRCNQIVLTGLDADILAFTTTADPTPLTPHTELAARLTNRKTYNVHPAPEGYELQYRDRWIIATRTHPIIPAHKCGHRFPGFLEPPTPKPQHHEHPPF